VSPESESIFDFIIQLYNSCDGNWKHLGHSLGIPDDELGRFLEFAATFLSNVGNYYVG
jgi:dipeptidyl-peptidase-3